MVNSGKMVALAHSCGIKLDFVCKCLGYCFFVLNCSGSKLKWCPIRFEVEQVLLVLALAFNGAIVAINTIAILQYL